MRTATAGGWGLALLLSAVGCHRASEEAVAPSPPPVEAPEGFSRVIIRAPVQTPVGVRVAPAVSIVGGHANPSGPTPTPQYERVDAFPISRHCPKDSMCTVVIRKRMGAVVFTFDPVVEVELSPPAQNRGFAQVRYANPTSVSATLQRLYEHSVALSNACGNRRLDNDVRRRRGQPIEREIRELARSDGRGVIRRAAGLALVGSQCTDDPLNREIAGELLENLEPTAPELTLWTDALRRLGATARDPARADAFRRQVESSHPNAEVRARLLFLRLHDLGDDADPREREELRQRLAAPELSATVSARMVEFLDRARDAIALEPGDTLPALELARIDGGTLRTDGTAPHRQLLYFSSSWCKGCIQALPKVRQLAEANPDLRLVYVMLDTEKNSREFVEQRAPVPGEVVWTEDSLRPSVFKFGLMPSFVLADVDGEVLATSDETKLDELAQMLAELKPTTPDE